MNQRAIVDHTRGLCGKPDILDDTLTLPRWVAEENPPHCRCCGSEMRVEECSSVGMGQLGMYWLICPACPAPPKKEASPVIDL